MVNVLLFIFAAIVATIAAIVLAFATLFFLNEPLKKAAYRNNRPVNPTNSPEYQVLAQMLVLFPLLILFYLIFLVCVFQAFI